MNDFRGIIIEESLKDKSLLQKMLVEETKTTTVTAEHQTSWLKQWTLHTVRVPAAAIDDVSATLSRELCAEPSTWYADLKNPAEHYIIFPGKIFKVDRSKKEQYDEVTAYGVAHGIPEYQLDFSPEIL